MIAPTRPALARAIDAHVARGPAESPACPGGCGGDCDPHRDDGLCPDCRPVICDRCDDAEARPGDHLCAGCHRELTRGPAPRLDASLAHRGASAPIVATLRAMVLPGVVIAAAAAVALTVAMAGDGEYLADCDAARWGACEEQAAQVAVAPVPAPKEYVLELVKPDRRRQVIRRGLTKRAVWEAGRWASDTFTDCIVIVRAGNEHGAEVYRFLPLASRERA